MTRMSYTPWPICMMAASRPSAGGMISRGRTLDDPISQRALQATKPLVQEIILPETKEPGYDVAIPVFIPRGSKKWGTIRVGFSLERAYGLIHQTRRDLLLLSLAAIVCGTSLAIFLAMRISRPIGHLVAAAHELGQRILRSSRSGGRQGRDRLSGHAFEQMRTSLLRHLESLADEKRRLEESNRKLARDATAAHSERKYGCRGQGRGAGGPRSQ